MEGGDAMQSSRGPLGLEEAIRDSLQNQQWSQEQSGI